MDRLAGAWNEAETEAFLDSATVPLRLSCHSNGESLWMLSLWFLYRDDAFWCATSADADVVDYLAAADVNGPDGHLVVDVDGERYRVAESDAEPLG